jgi:hypothetical protein
MLNVVSQQFTTFFGDWDAIGFQAQSVSVSDMLRPETSPYYSYWFDYERLMQTSAKVSVYITSLLFFPE